MRWLKDRKLRKSLKNVITASKAIDGLLISDDKEELIFISTENFKKENYKEYINSFDIENRKISITLWGKNSSDFDTYFEFIKNWLLSEYSKKAVLEETLNKYREISIISNVALKLNRSLNLKEVANIMVEESKKLVPKSKHGAVIIEEKEGFFVPISYFGENCEEIAKHIVDTNLFMEIYNSQKGEIINYVVNDDRWNAFIPEIVSILMVPLFSPDRKIGVLWLSSTTTFNSEDLQIISTIGTFGATALANTIYFKEIEAVLEGIIVSLATAIDARDPTTAGHSKRVAQYAWWLAEAINEDKELFPDVYFTEEQLKEIYRAALLHDVGKIGVRESVLQKSSRISEKSLDVIKIKLQLLKEKGKLPEELSNLKEVFKRLENINIFNKLGEEDKKILNIIKELSLNIGDESIPVLSEYEYEALSLDRGNLTKEELKEIQNHSAESYRILSQIPFPKNMKDLLKIVRQHHEKLDGTGYPDGLKEKDILLQSRIIAVCDIYDALVASDRPYKKAMPPEKAIKILNEEAQRGKLDKKVVKIFTKVVGSY